MYKCDIGTRAVVVQVRSCCRTKLCKKIEEKAVHKALLWLKVGHKKLRAGPKNAPCEFRSHDLRMSLYRPAYGGFVL